MSSTSAGAAFRTRSVVAFIIGIGLLLKRTNVCLYALRGRAARMAREYHLISADSHILEPPHLWKEYMPRKFHDKAPNFMPDGEGGEAWQFSPDVPPAPLGIYASAGR